MKTIKEELRAWCRPISPLTAFAKSVRNEQGGAQDDPSKASKGEYVDPLADFDFDELPKDQQDRLKKLQTDYRAQFDEKAQLEAKRKQTEDFARQQQSRADKLEALVRNHNLPTDGKPSGNHVSADAKRIQDLQAKLEADGLKPEAAAGYAKMLSMAGEQQRQEIYAELAPLMGEVGTLKANQVLTNARVQYQQVFAIPELNKQINDNVQLLVQQGQPVDDKTVTHLISMAWGQYALANPEALKAKPDVTQNHQLPTLGSPSVTHGGHHTTSSADPQAPRATQPETIAIMSNLKNFFEADLPKGKGGKK